MMATNILYILLFYGVVAYSTKIDRKEINNENEIRKYDTTIELDICRWYGYWDLKSIITRGIKRLENRYVGSDVKIIYNDIEHTDNSLENLKYLDVKLCDR